MRASELASAASVLNRTLVKLRERWAEARETWNDDASRQFADQFLKPLPDQFQLATAAINHLAEVTAEAERDCADPDRAW